MTMTMPIARSRCAVAPDGLCAFAPLGPGDDKSGKVGAVEVWQCRHCKVGVTMPPLPDVAFLYDNRESQDFQPDARGIVHRIKDAAFRLQARTLIRQLPARPATVLDFGCGSGQFTRCLAGLLPEAEVTGSDFHAEPPADLAGRSYRPIAALGPLAGRFDLVTAFHVLEHDDDAAGLLARIAAMARPGGHIVIEVPNIDCVWAGLLGRAWDAWYLPYHRTHFSPASLAALVGEAGLEIVARHDVTVPTMGRSIANALGVANGLPTLLAGIALHPLQWAGERISGRPSALRLILRRPA
jgi:2-polyprenyl-3-methyl-5-hydroxy-6-metoxy-1,4-benzoquinol methylase